ncbi:MAG: PA0069 family radical SAM protein [Proteobacteria bacterium]|nr:PA0069 family radical SAM protein [Pseudomonadota bacterium]
MRRTSTGGPPLKGHGALSNPPGRFDRTQVESVDDGWYLEETPEHPATTLEPERARSVISRNESPDIPFEQSINPYRGCAHACVYCYARPSHAYLGLSPGLDFETRLFYKQDAAALLERELSHPGYVARPIMLGANTDPYQPVERRMRVTRSLLEVLQRTRHPVMVTTKGALVLRDADLLADLARDGLASVAISIPTLDVELKRQLEPQAASPQARLRAMAALTAAGVPCGVMVAPIIAALTGHEIEAILEAAAAAGARWAGYSLLRLPYEVKDLFKEWLAAHYPERAAHVMSLVRGMRGGRENDPAFGSRMHGTGAYAAVLRSRFQVACRRLGLQTASHQGLSTGHFRPPGGRGSQLGLDFTE